MNEHAKLHECISSRNSFLVSENTIIHMKCKKKKKKDKQVLWEYDITLMCKVGRA